MKGARRLSSVTESNHQIIQIKLLILDLEIHRAHFMNNLTIDHFRYQKFSISLECSEANNR